MRKAIRYRLRATILTLKRKDMSDGAFLCMLSICHNSIRKREEYVAQVPLAEYDDMNKVAIDRTRHIMFPSPSSSRMNPMCRSVAGSRNPPLDRVDLTQRRPWLPGPV